VKKQVIRLVALAFVVVTVGSGAWGQGSGARFEAPDVVTATDVSYPMNTTTTGMVSLWVSLDASGSVQKIDVAQDVPPLTAAAQASVQNWTFKAATAHGKGVATKFPVHVVFNPYNPGATSVVGGGLKVPQTVPSNQLHFMPPQIRLASYAFYPPNTQVEGTVVLSVSVDKSGHSSHIKVVHGVPPLADAAVDAVKQWGFQPAMRDGATAAGRLCIAFLFQRNLS
jgi:TonB family protein